MEQRILSDGGVGLGVSALCLGTMHFGTTVDEDSAFAILDRFIEAGGTFIDTANTYAFWVPGCTGAESEELLGRWVTSRRARDQVVLATKVGALPDPPGADWPEHAEGLSRRVVRDQTAASMRRLGVDHLDVCYAHIEDRRTPLADTVDTFASLVADGMARVVGCSNHAAWRVASAREIARAAGVPGFTCVQQRHTYLRQFPGWANTSLRWSSKASVLGCGVVTGVTAKMPRVGASRSGTAATSARRAPTSEPGIMAIACPVATMASLPGRSTAVNVTFGITPARAACERSSALDPSLSSTHSSSLSSSMSTFVRPASRCPVGTTMVIESWPIAARRTRRSDGRPGGASVTTAMST